MIRPKTAMTTVPTIIGKIWYVPNSVVLSQVEPVKNARPWSVNVDQERMPKKTTTPTTRDNVKSAADVEIAKKARSPLATCRVFIGVR